MIMILVVGTVVLQILAVIGNWSKRKQVDFMNLYIIAEVGSKDEDFSIKNIAWKTEDRENDNSGYIEEAKILEAIG